MIFDTSLAMIGRRGTGISLDGLRFSREDKTWQDGNLLAATMGRDEKFLSRLFWTHPQIHRPVPLPWRERVFPSRLVTSELRNYKGGLESLPRVGILWEHWSHQVHKFFFFF